MEHRYIINNEISARQVATRQDIMGAMDVMDVMDIMDVFSCRNWYHQILSSSRAVSRVSLLLWVWRPKVKFISSSFYITTLLIRVLISDETCFLDYQTEQTIQSGCDLVIFDVNCTVSRLMNSEILYGIHCLSLDLFALTWISAQSFSNNVLTPD